VNPAYGCQIEINCMLYVVECRWFMITEITDTEKFHLKWVARH